MPKRITEEVRNQIQTHLRAGVSPPEIAAQLSVSRNTVISIRADLNHWLKQEGLPELPRPQRGVKSQPLTAEEHAARAEYIQTGSIRPLARRLGWTQAKLLYVLDRAPSAIATRRAKYPPKKGGQNG